jgi:hypothetical protein
MDLKPWMFERFFPGLLCVFIFIYPNLLRSQQVK